MHALLLTQLLHSYVHPTVEYSAICKIMIKNEYKSKYQLLYWQAARSCKNFLKTQNILLAINVYTCIYKYNASFNYFITSNFAYNLTSISATDTQFTHSMSRVRENGPISPSSTSLSINEPVQKG